MAKGLVWATVEDLARNRGRVLSMYRQVLRSLNSPELPMNLAARLHKKAEARAIFMLASEERSLHNIEDLIDVAEFSAKAALKYLVHLGVAFMASEHVYITLKKPQFPAKLSFLTFWCIYGLYFSIMPRHLILLGHRIHFIHY